jgi:phage tail sheath gpL-like
MPVDVNAVARVLGIDVKFVPQVGGNGRSLPQRICVIAQGASASTFSTTKFQATSAGQVGNLGGFGSPAHLILDQLMPANGDGVGTIPVDVCLLADDGSGAAAVGDITPSSSPPAPSRARR